MHLKLKPLAQSNITRTHGTFLLPLYTTQPLNVHRLTRTPEIHQNAEPKAAQLILFCSVCDFWPSSLTARLSNLSSLTKITECTSLTINKEKFLFWGAPCCSTFIYFSDLKLTVEEKDKSCLWI